MNCIINKKYPLDHQLTDEDRKELIEENKDNDNYSYICLLKEMLHYKHMTVESLLNGWGGVQLFIIPNNPHTN